MEAIFSHPSSSANFLSAIPLYDLRVDLAPNRLDSCYQYHVKEEHGLQLLKVKIYDKVLDLIGRDHYHQVGSRVSMILDTSNEKGLLQKRIRDCQSTGLTRLEVSVLHDAIEKFNVLKPPVRTLCHDKVSQAMGLMV